MRSATSSIDSFRRRGRSATTRCAMASLALVVLAGLKGDARGVPAATGFGVVGERARD